MGIGDITKGRSTCHIRAVGKFLILHSCCSTDFLKSCCRYAIRGVLLVGIVLDYYTMIHHWTVHRICLIQIVWMDGMGIIAGQHEGIGNGHGEVLLVHGQILLDAIQHIGQEGRVCALLGSRANLLIIIDCQHRNCVHHAVFT